MTEQTSPLPPVRGLVRVRWRDMCTDPQNKRRLLVALAGEVQVSRTFLCPRCGELTAWLDWGCDVRCAKCDFREEACFECFAQPGVRESCEKCGGRGWKTAEECGAEESADGTVTRFLEVEYAEGEEPPDDEPSDKFPMILSLSSLVVEAGLDEGCLLRMIWDSCAELGVGETGILNRDLTQREKAVVLRAIISSCAEALCDFVEPPDEDDEDDEDDDEEDDEDDEERDESCEKCGRELRPKPMTAYEAARIRVTSRAAGLGELGDHQAYCWARSTVCVTTVNESLVCDCDKANWQRAWGEYNRLGVETAWARLGVTEEVMARVEQDRIDELKRESSSSPGSHDKN